MIYCGMAQWHHPSWCDWVYPSKMASSERLAAYAQVFNSVEVGSTFYADVSSTQLQHWFELVPDSFRFSFKAPQAITHHFDQKSEAQVVGEWRGFIDRIGPLASKLGPIMLQFPAKLDGSYLHLIERLLECWALPTPLSVEVRNLSFFDKRDGEVSLLRLLREHSADRVIMDSRPVFSVVADTPALVDAQSKKPRVPCHAVVTANNPVVRFIGHPDLSRNQRWLDEWAKKIAIWLVEGRTPYVFVHTADNVDAPALAQHLMALIPNYLPSFSQQIFLPSKPAQIHLL